MTDCGVVSVNMYCFKAAYFQPILVQYHNEIIKQYYSQPIFSFLKPL